MNPPLVSTLFNYAKKEIERGWNLADLPEIRLLFDKVSASVFFETACLVEDFIDRSGKKLEFIVKASNISWQEWQRDPKLSQITSSMKSKNWIVEDDTLTHYRNMKCSDGFDGLVIMLFDVRSVLDAGGLADFHVVDENYVWSRLMGESYDSWTGMLFDDLGFSDEGSVRELLDEYFETLFRVLPRDLSLVSEFIYQLLSKRNQFTTALDVVQHVYADLPYWGLAPIIDLNVKDAASYIEPDLRYISYSNFLELNERKKAIQKIDKAAQAGELTLPNSISTPHPFGTEEAFIGSLRDYILYNDKDIRKKLLRVDCVPVLKALKKKKASTKKPPKPVVLEGPLYQCFLRAVTLATLDLQGSSADALQGLQIVVHTFEHDFVETSDDSEDSTLQLDPREDAELTLRGCLGGIEQFMDFGIKTGSEGAVARVELHSLSESTDYKSKKTGTPRLFVTVSASGDDLEDAPRSEFYINLQDYHEERIAFNLIRAARLIFDEKEIWLPLFHVGTYDEVFFATDPIEANRILKNGMDGFSVKELYPDELKERVKKEFPQVHELIRKLREAYWQCLLRIEKNGLFAALEYAVSNLLEAYRALVSEIVANPALANSDIANAVYKAYLIGPRDTDIYAHYLPSAIVTMLHPSMLELVQAREMYLRTSFPQVLASALAEHQRHSLEDSIEVLLGMVELQRPLACLIVDRARHLSTKIRSFGLIHCLGNRRTETIALASQAIIQPEQLDNDMAAADLFGLTQESRCFLRVLTDYRKLHEYTDDGIKILAIGMENVQALIAAVDSFLRNLLKKRAGSRYKCSLKIVCRSASAQGLNKWLSAWRRTWNDSSRSRYEGCDLRVSFVQVGTSHQYVDLLNSDKEDYDVAFISRFLGSVEEDEHLLEPAEHFRAPLSGDHMKFPICEYPKPITDNFAKQKNRTVKLTNHRLLVSTLHTELTACLAIPHASHRGYSICSVVDYSRWVPVVDVLHEKARWVACVDPNIDRLLLNARSEGRSGQREIVGFSTGLGAHGELNLTVSTEKDTIQGLRTKLSRKLRNILPVWTREDCDQASAVLIAQAQKLTGLSLIRAVGEGEYIRDLAAFSLVSKAIRSHGKDHLIDILLPLDSFPHWFRGVESRYSLSEEWGRIPDLLHLRGTFDGEKLCLKASVIECKFASENEQHINKAISQVENGLLHLANAFLPAGLSQDQYCYSRRYWWAQLHRAIASNTVVKSSQFGSAVSGLDKLLEGTFEIGWSASIITFWLDRTNIEERSKLDTVDLGQLLNEQQFVQRADDDLAVSIQHIALGTNQTKELCLQDLATLALDSQYTILRPAQSDISGTIKRLERIITEPSARSQQQGNEVADGAADSGTKGAATATLDSETSTESQHATLNDTESSIERDKSVRGDVSAASVVAATQDANLQKIPDRILLGNAGVRPVFWEFGNAELSNRHLLIFGKSGSGKTYAIQAILLELATKGQHSVIVDYTEGFVPKQLQDVFRQSVNPVNHFVRQTPLPINPLRRQSVVIDDHEQTRLQESSYETAMRVMSVFASVYNLGEQQKAALVRSIENSLDQHGDATTLADVLNELQAQGTSGATLASKIEPYVKHQLFAPEQENNWDLFFAGVHKVSVIQFQSLSREYATIATEFALWDLFYYAQQHGSVSHPLPVVLDEVQNLDHRLDSPLGKILTEGRKFGLSLILATQTLSALKADEQDRLFQAAHKLYFSPADTEVREYAKLLERSDSSRSVDEWSRELTSLSKGECISVGPSWDGIRLRTKPCKIKITALDQRTSR